MRLDEFALLMRLKTPWAYIGGVLAVGPELSSNRWHHLAMSYDGVTLRLYTDGKEVAATKTEAKRPPGNTSLAIGRRQDGALKFSGLTDEVRLYNRVLTGDEIKANYDAMTAKPPKRPAAEGNGLVREWTFDDPEDPVNLWQKSGLEPAYRDLLGGSEAKEPGKK